MMLFRQSFGLRSIRARLMVACALLTFLPLGLLGWVMWRTFDHFYLTRLQDDMSLEAGLMAEQATTAILSGGRIEAPDLIINPPPPLRSQVRVLLFNATGQLLGASDPTLEALVGQTLNEPGLATALTGHATQGEEVSSMAGVPVAYVTQPVLNQGQVIGAIHLAYTLSDIQSAQWILSLLIATATLLVAVLVGLLSLWLTRSITQPLMRVSAAAADIASGHFGRRVPETAPTELAALAKSFNQMAEALQDAEQARHVAFANIAHDVRTPLGSIRAASEALAAGAAEQPELRDRLLSGVVNHVHYLSRLTDDLLRLATYEGGRLILCRQAVQLPPLVQQTLHGIELWAQARSVTLAVDLPSTCPPVWADADRVLEILFNLLDNALTYTPTDGEIRMSVRPEPTCVWVHVCDTGPGLPNEALPHLVERYWRGGVAPRQGVNMGLGLNIVHKIVAAHGGVLAIGNRPEGGADFAFSLPRAA